MPRASKSKAAAEAAEIVKTPDVINPEAAVVEDAAVINPKVTDKSGVESVAAPSKVLVAYNGFQAQRFEAPLRNGVKAAVVINGNNRGLIGKESGALVSGGYGLTYVDREVWEWIKKNYAEWPPIKTGLMFATDSEHVADETKAREAAGLKNGFEPLDRAAITAGVTEAKK